MKHLSTLCLLSSAALLFSCGGQPTSSQNPPPSSDKETVSSSLNSLEEKSSETIVDSKAEESHTSSSSSNEESSEIKESKEESPLEAPSSEEIESSNGESEPSEESEEASKEELSESSQEGSVVEESDEPSEESSEESPVEEVLYHVFTTRLNRATVTFLNEGNGIYHAGDTVSFTATPSLEGYVVDSFRFTDGGGLTQYLHPVEGVYSFEMPEVDVYLTNSVTKKTRLFLDVDSHATVTLLDEIQVGQYFTGLNSIRFTVEIESGYSLLGATYSGNDFERGEVSGDVTIGEEYFSIPAIQGDITLSIVTLADVIDDGSDPWSKKGSDTLYEGKYYYYNYGVNYEMVMTIKIHANQTLDIDLIGYWDDYYEEWGMPIFAGYPTRGSRDYISGKKNLPFTYSTGQISFDCPYNTTSKELALSLSESLTGGVPTSLTCLDNIYDQYYQCKGCVLTQKASN